MAHSFTIFVCVPSFNSFSADFCMYGVCVNCKSVGVSLKLSIDVDAVCVIVCNLCLNLLLDNRSIDGNKKSDAVLGIAVHKFGEIFNRLLNEFCDVEFVVKDDDDDGDDDIAAECSYKSVFVDYGIKHMQLFLFNIFKNF